MMPLRSIPACSLVCGDASFPRRVPVLPAAAIGYAREAIRHGYQTVMVAGGAEELCPSEAAVFDTLFATSQRNDAPKTTPSPFDTARDGLVIGEGAGTLILEELEHAKARGATIYGEIVGFATNCDAAHITQPQRETMQICMEQSLAMAGLGATDIGYISAHGTATDRGDIAESQPLRPSLATGSPLLAEELFWPYVRCLRCAGSVDERADDA